MDNRTKYDQMMNRVFNTSNINVGQGRVNFEKLNWVNQAILNEGYCAGNSNAYGPRVVNVPCLSQPWSFQRSEFDQKYYR